MIVADDNYSRTPFNASSFSTQGFTIQQEPLNNLQAKPPVTQTKNSAAARHFAINLQE